MTRLPKLAIVGRPNVGKSALFNRICKKRIAIVDEEEGVTRDRLYSSFEYFGRQFELIDTGGIDPRSTAPFNELIKQQAEIAIEEADSLILVVDAKIGITALDQEVAKILLKTNKPLCLAVNKVDHPDQIHLIHEFYGLGISSMQGVSADHDLQIAELVDLAINSLPDQTEEDAVSFGPKLAIVGRPNVGKSTLINYLLNEERCIVSEIAGTTRDSIDLPVLIDEKPYTLIDTAGIKRKNNEKNVIEKFAFIRTKKAIQRADICLLILDAQEGMTRRDKKIANLIEESGKGCILLFNKWDLVKKTRMEHCLKQIEKETPFLHHCPKIFIAAKTGRNVDKIFPQVEIVTHFAHTRISTGQLNRFIATTTQKVHSPMIRGKRLRIYYMTQIETQPPRFLLFINSPTLLAESYRRFILNQFRETFQFTGLPIQLILKGKEKRQPQGKTHPVAINDPNWVPDLTDLVT